MAPGRRKTGASQQVQEGNRTTSSATKVVSPDASTANLYNTSMLAMITYGLKMMGSILVVLFVISVIMALTVYSLMVWYEWLTQTRIV